MYNFKPRFDDTKLFNSYLRLENCIKRGNFRLKYVLMAFNNKSESDLYINRIIFKHIVLFFGKKAF